MSEAEHMEVIRRGQEALHIMEHPMVVDALNAMRADVYSKIEMTGWNDKEAREALYHQLKAITNFEAQFQFHIEEGRMALSLLDKWRAEKRAKRSRRS